MTDYSYQLYSSRNFPPLGDTFTMLAGLGYTQVEGFGAMYPPGSDVAGLKSMLDANGLTMPTGHLELSYLETDPAGAIETARTLGMKAVFAPFLAPELRPTDAAGWAAFGQRVAEAGKPVMDAGLAFGWHNHDFEMVQMDGEFVLDLILAGSDELGLELDLAWVKVGGQDPVEWIEKHAHRLITVHLKDIAPAGEAVDEDGWADVGHGVMDWPAIKAALAKTKVAYQIMEHDNPSDHERFARRSITSAQNF
ncbi:sugar phosphate isomerase/epimerase [bacterium]|nr:sugar phosphate isomerase/epimerase [bacterium]